MNRCAHFFLLVTGALIMNSSAKEPVKKAAVLDHPQKVHVDKKNKKLYWPLGKPFWVRIAESADSSAKSYLLSDEIDSIKTDTETRLGGSNLGDKGIRLDVTGRQALRWYNMVTGEKHALRFYSDGDAPGCAAKLPNIPRHVSGTHVFYGKGLVLELTAEDKMSGLGQIYASANNAPYQPYTGALTFATEMAYDISYYAVDNVGNVSVPQTISFTIDLSAPQTQINYDNTYKTKDGKITLSRLQSLSLVATDSLSGVSETFYRIKEDKFSTYKSAISLKNFQDGEYQISFYSIDNVGNQESPKTFSFEIDNISPVPNVSFEGDLFEFKKGQLIISPRTLVRVDAKDNRTEVGSIEYSINNSAFIPYQAPVPVSTNPGKHLIAVKASDRLGNTSPVTTLSVTLDTKAPQSSYSFNGAMYKNNYIVCITPQTRISISSEDDLSGVKLIQYSFQGDKPSSYVEPFPIPAEGSYILKFRGIDQVNNQEEIQMVPVMVDNTPPVLTETFSSPKLTASGDTSVSRFPKSTTLFLQATDNASGVAGIWYSINGKNESKYEKPIRFDKKGEHKVVIRALDNVGKVTEKTLSFLIED